MNNCAGVSFNGGSFKFNPGIVTTFPVNTIPYIDSSSALAYDSLFTYQGGKLGIGIGSSLLAKLHVKGDNDSTGSALKIQTATYDAINVYNNRKIVIGSGSTVAGTDYLINSFSTGASDTDTTLTINGYNGDNIFRFSNAYTYSRGGLEIVRSSTSNSRTALGIYGGSTLNFYITSSGVLGFGTENAWADSGETYIQRVSSSGKKGLWFNVGNSTDYGFIFHQGRTTMGITTVPFMRLYTDFTDGGLGSGSFTQKFFTIDPSYNYTGSAVVDIIGMDYNPNIIANNGGGKHYGLLVRSGLAGFGLGTTLPVAQVHVGAGTTAISQMKLESSAAPTGGALTDGCLWNEAGALKFRTGGVTKTITLV